MNEIDDLKYIKKYYGEKMMQLCRELFPIILETPGMLSKIMEECFYPTKHLYYDIKNNALENQFKNYIYKKYNYKEKKLETTTKTPQELMKEVGYELFECHTEEDIQKFRKFYYKKEQKYTYYNEKGIPRYIGEELCTFNGGRLESCHVFFAIKNNAEKLKREDFTNPRREDDYGISVISIQFSKNNHTLSIKNRYNHTVNNPDATFGNNLENIIPGLTKSFEKHYGYKIKSGNEGNFEIPGYVEVDGKFYKYNYELNNIYYCPTNIIIKDGIVKQYPQEQYIIMDYFILDLKNKTLTLLSESSKDGLVEEYKNIEKIEIKKEETKKKIIITNNGQESVITINNQNQIIEYENKTIKELKNNFMIYNDTLEQINLPELRVMNNCCFMFAEKIKRIVLPNLRIMKNECFHYDKIEILELPLLETIGDSCFNNGETMLKLYLPSLQIMGRDCFALSNNMIEISLPEIIEIGENSFTHCQSLETINCPKIEVMGERCFINCDVLQEVILPKLELMNCECFMYAPKITKFHLQKLKRMNMKCFWTVKEIKELIAPELETMGTGCFAISEYRTHHLHIFEVPKLKDCRSEKIERIIRNINSWKHKRYIEQKKRERKHKI